MFLFRGLLSLVISTHFDPDEWWQNLEPAFNMVTGEGKLTWEWSAGLRSYYPVLLHVPMFFVLNALNIHSPTLVIRISMIVQSFVVAGIDLLVYKISCSFYRTKPSYIALFINVTNWFVQYAAVRPSINTVESFFVLLCIYYIKSDRFEAACMATAFILWTRVTSAFFLIPFWIPFCFDVKNAILVVRNLIIFALGEFFMHGRIIFPALNILMFNATGANDFGLNSVHFYFSQAIFIISGLFSPFVVVTLIKNPKKLWKIAFPMIVFSFIGHKEFRWIFPCAFLLCFVIATVLERYWLSNWFKYVAVTIVIFSFVSFVFFARFHQEGRLQVVRFVHEQCASQVDECRVAIVESLHHFPGPAVIHSHVPIKYYGTTFITETEDIRRDPIRYVMMWMEESKDSINVFIFNSRVEDKVVPYVEQLGYGCYEFENSFVDEEEEFVYACYR
ncbi:hypothetical protein PCE1_002800 [Barthelona sp. PCE]